VGGTWPAGAISAASDYGLERKSSTRTAENLSKVAVEIIPIRRSSSFYTLLLTLVRALPCPGLSVV
jgi:hypothetical protein